MADDAPDDDAHELRHIDRRLERFIEAFEDFITNPDNDLDQENAMSLLSDLQAIRADVQAINAAFPKDIQSAIAAQKATDDAANAATIAELAAAQTEVTGLQGDVAALKATAGLAATALTPVPSSISIPVGSTTAIPFSVIGTTGTVSETGLPAGVTFDGTNINPDGSQVAGTSSAVFTDSGTSASATVPVTVA